MMKAHIHEVIELNTIRYNYCLSTWWERLIIIMLSVLVCIFFRQCSTFQNIAVEWNGWS